MVDYGSYHGRGSCCHWPKFTIAATMTMARDDISLGVKHNDGFLWAILHLPNTKGEPPLHSQAASTSNSHREISQVVVSTFIFHLPEVSPDPIRLQGIICWGVEDVEISHPLHLRKGIILSSIIYSPLHPQVLGSRKSTADPLTFWLFWSILNVGCR